MVPSLQKKSEPLDAIGRLWQRRAEENKLLETKEFMGSKLGDAGIFIYSEERRWRRIMRSPIITLLPYRMIISLIIVYF